MTLIDCAAVARPPVAWAQLPARRPLIALLFATSQYGEAFAERMWAPDEAIE